MTKKLNHTSLTDVEEEFDICLVCFGLYFRLEWFQFHIHEAHHR